MTYSMHTAAALIALAAAGSQAGPSGGQFEIVSYTVDAGGVTNAGGDGFSLSGTVGQPDASPTMTGGSFSLTGGFWPGVGNLPACPADINNDGVLNFFDVSAFITAFNTSQPDGDFNKDGNFNFFDVSAFLGAFNTGCP